MKTARRQSAHVRVLALADALGFLECNGPGAYEIDADFWPALRASRERFISALWRAAIGRPSPASPGRAKRTYPKNGAREVARRQRQVDASRWRSFSRRELAAMGLALPGATLQPENMGGIPPLAARRQAR